MSREPLGSLPSWTGSLFSYGYLNPAGWKDPSGAEPCYDDHGNEQPEAMCVKLNPRSPDEERGVDISCTFASTVAGAVEKVEGWVDDIKGLLGEYSGFRNAKLRDDHLKHAKDWNFTGDQ